MLLLKSMSQLHGHQKILIMQQYVRLALQQATVRLQICQQSYEVALPQNVKLDILWFKEEAQRK